MTAPARENKSGAPAPARGSDTRNAPLAILCGGGALPLQVAAVAARTRPVFLIGLRGIADPAIERYPHVWIKLGEAGRPLRALKERGCHELCFIGYLTRPRLFSLAFDRVTLRIASRLARLWIGGDDRLLSGLARIIEHDFGLRIVGAHQVAPEILAPEGPMTVRKPAPRDLADVAVGLAVLRALGPHDVGQAVVVAQGRVLAVEAAEGTDGMIERVAELRRSGRVGLPARAGVLVKAPKPGQDRRIDLPAVGARTVELAARAGLNGIAVAAGATLVADLEAMLATAAKEDLFITGMREDDGAREGHAS